MFAIGTRNYHVSVNRWNGEVKIHLRKYIDCEDGVKKPTKIGVTLNLSEFADLKAQLLQIDEAVQNAMLIPQRPPYQRQCAVDETNLTPPQNTEIIEEIWKEQQWQGCEKRGNECSGDAQVKKFKYDESFYDSDENA